MSINTNVNLSPTNIHSNNTSNNTSNSFKSEIFQGLESEKPNPIPNEKRKDLNQEEVTKITGEMNKFMQMINSDIQFEVHEKTNRLMVKVVDREGKVLKEFPSRELLDTMAKISEYVGILLDKKA